MFFPLLFSWHAEVRKSVQHRDSEPCLGKGPFPQEKTLPCLRASTKCCAQPVTHIPVSHSHLAWRRVQQQQQQLVLSMWCCIDRSTRDMQPHDPRGCPKQCHHQETGTVFARGSATLCSGVLFFLSLCRRFLSGACPCACTYLTHRQQPTVLMAFVSQMLPR